MPGRRSGIIGSISGEPSVHEHEMPERQSPLQAFRHLEHKRETVGLTPAERVRYDQLKAIVAAEAPAPAKDPEDAEIEEALEILSEPRAADLAVGELLGAGGPSSGEDPDAPARDPDRPRDPGSELGDASRPEDLDVSADEAAMALDALGATAEGGDQPARDAERARPVLDRAGAFDLDAPSFDAPGPVEDPGGAGDAVILGSEPGLDGAPAASDSGTLSYDLSPMAFDAAALPPELGRGEGGRAAFDTPAAVTPLSDLAGGEPLPEVELLEADLVEADLAEADLVDREPPRTGPARAPQEQGADLFATVLPPPAGGGEQPLDATAFTGEELATGREEPAAGEGHPPPAAAAFGGPAEPGAEEPPAGLELVLDVEREEPAPRADEPLPASPGEAAALQEAATKEMSAVEVDLGEIDDEPVPPSVRRPSSTFVAGEHRVLVQTVGGEMLRGTFTDVDLDAPDLPLAVRSGAAPEPIARAGVKAIFFMLPPGGRPAAAEGRKVRVTFRDGRQVAGFGVDHDLDTVGFFLVPAESRTGTGRIWVYREAVQRLSVS